MGVKFHAQGTQSKVETGRPVSKPTSLSEVQRTKQYTNAFSTENSCLVTTTAGFVPAESDMWEGKMEKFLNCQHHSFPLRWCASGRSSCPKI